MNEKTQAIYSLVFDRVIEVLRTPVPTRHQDIFFW